jgi:hypothetical protein
MSTLGYRPPYLSEADLKALVLEGIAGGVSGRGLPGLETFHARFHERAPEFNDDEWQWKYRIQTETVDGDELTIIIAVDTAARTFEVLTRWKPRN